VEIVAQSRLAQHWLLPVEERQQTGRLWQQWRPAFVPPTAAG
jgi:hypothetical protein